MLETKQGQMAPGRRRHIYSVAEAYLVRNGIKVPQMPSHTLESLRQQPRESMLKTCTMPVSYLVLSKYLTHLKFSE